jgi:exopolyphosphatase / guanosine-5'-triphosphate,3'-diphosphate pyrophosphatase
VACDTWPVTGANGRDRQPLAVIDIGSNSGRLVVVRVDEVGHLDVLETIGTPLRLVHELAGGSTLGEAVVDRTLTALRGFQAVARGAGARQTRVVATAAAREATNGDDFIRALRRGTGLDIEVISAEAEARYGFLGAVYGLPVDHGMVVDIGGGSMQVAHFRDRCLLASWSLPLGALRLSDRFLMTDLPTALGVRRLQEHVRRTLREAGVPSVRDDEQVVGTGGTIRSLARMDRVRQTTGSPIHRLHGYLLAKRALGSIVDDVVQQPAARRAQAPGLNPSRFDSIVGGALCAQVTLDAVGGSSILVSGQGLREGIGRAQTSDRLPPAEEVRAVAVTALGSRFATWNHRAAEERARVAASLMEVLDREAAPELRESLIHAARLLDIGRSVDLYNRHEHTMGIVMAADLSGFSHRGIALLGALVRLTGKDGANLKSFAPLVGPLDQAPLARMAAILALADALVAQAPPHARAHVRCERHGARVALSAAWLDAWPLQSAIRRLQQIFAVEVHTGSRDA